MRSKKNVLLIEPFQLIRKMIRLALTQRGQGIRIVGEAQNGAEALIALSKKKSPIVVLLSSRIPDVPARRLVQILHNTYPTIRIIVLGKRGPVLSSLTFIRAGASAYLSWQQSVSAVVNAIHTATPQQPFLSQDLVDLLIMQRFEPSPLQQKLARLSDREWDIIPYLAQGSNDSSIAETLQVSDRAVCHQRHRILKKLALPNAVALTHLAAQLKLIEV